MVRAVALRDPRLHCAQIPSAHEGGLLCTAGQVRLPWVAHGNSFNAAQSWSWAPPGNTRNTAAPARSGLTWCRERGATGLHLVWTNAMPHLHLMGYLELETIRRRMTPSLTVSPCSKGGKPAEDSIYGDRQSSNHRPSLVRGLAPERFVSQGQISPSHEAQFLGKYGWDGIPCCFPRFRQSERASPSSYCSVRSFIDDREWSSSESLSLPTPSLELNVLGPAAAERR